MRYERTARMKLKNGELLEFGEKERSVFPKLLEQLRTPKRPQELANKYGNVVYYLITKMLKAGMIEKTKKEYVLSSGFAEKLRKWAEEWKMSFPKWIRILSWILFPIFLIEILINNFLKR